jgi:hypothetical protein
MMGLVAIDFTSRWELPVYVDDGPPLTKAISGPLDALLQIKTLRCKSGSIYWHAFDLPQQALTD